MEMGAMQLKEKVLNREIFHLILLILLCMGALRKWKESHNFLSRSSNFIFPKVKLNNLVKIF